MEKKQWIVFLQLFVSFLTLLIILVSIISGTVKVKDGVNAIKLTDSACSAGSNETFDAAIGDIMIKLGEGFQLVEFTQPYVEAKPLDKSRPWLFAELEKNDLVLPNTTRNKELEQKELEHGLRSLREIMEGMCFYVAETVLDKIYNFNRMQSRFIKKHDRKTMSNSNIEVKIGLQVRSIAQQSMEASLLQKQITGFTLDVFKAAVKLLPYKLNYQIVPFYSSDYNLLTAVSHKTFDAAVGDILIRAEGYQFVDFSQPYIDAGLLMVVATVADKSQPWLFTSPFSGKMWFIMAAMSAFTTFVIWLIEHQNHNDNACLAATRIASGEMPKSCLSHFVLVPWLFLMLVVTSTFTGSLTSIITNSRISASTIDVNMLKSQNAVIGCDGSSFVIRYLVKDLGFKRKNIRSMASTDDYAEALSGGKIKAAFILKPYAKVFLAKYCSGFTIAGPIYKLGGFGFAFQKSSSLTADISEAILRLSENGELQLMEEEMLFTYNCSGSPSDANVSQSLGPEPFIGLLIISTGASVIALFFHILRQQWNKMTNVRETLMGRRLWIWLVTLFTQNQTRNDLQLATRSSTP